MVSPSVISERLGRIGGGLLDAAPSIGLNSLGPLGIGIEQFRNRGKKEPAAPAPAAPVASPTVGPTAGAPPNPAYSGDFLAWQENFLRTLMANPPERSDFPPGPDGDADFQDEKMTWQSDFQTALGLYSEFKSLQVGMIPIGDGRYMSQAEFNNLSPQDQQRVQAIAQNYNTALQNDYDKLMTDYGIAEWTLKDSARRNDNDVLRSQSLDQIERQLSGMQESRSRSRQVEDVLASQQGWAVPNGQTSFTPQDFGGATANAARYAGLAPTDQLLNFTGTRTVDPAGMMAGYDQMLGVGGPLANIPTPTLSAPTPRFPTPLPPALFPVPGQTQTAPQMQQQRFALPAPGLLFEPGPVG